MVHLCPDWSVFSSFGGGAPAIPQIRNLPTPVWRVLCFANALVFFCFPFVCASISFLQCLFTTGHQLDGSNDSSRINSLLNYVHIVLFMFTAVKYRMVRCSSRRPDRHGKSVGARFHRRFIEPWHKRTAALLSTTTYNVDTLQLRIPGYTSTSSKLHHTQNPTVSASTARSFNCA